MFDSVQSATARDYTRTVAWLAIALLFIPAVFLGVRPGYVSLSLALLCGAICLAMAWISWKKSRMAIPSITPPQAAAKKG